MMCSISLNVTKIYSNLLNVTKSTQLDAISLAMYSNSLKLHPEILHPSNIGEQITRPRKRLVHIMQHAIGVRTDSESLQPDSDGPGTSRHIAGQAHAQQRHQCTKKAVPSMSRHASFPLGSLG